LKLVDRGEEFRRDVAHFDYADFGNFLDKQGIPASVDGAATALPKRSELGDNP
jgi:hypothetical protein